MSAALDAAIVQIRATARRAAIKARKADARRFIAEPWRLARVLPTIDALPPEDVLPALIDRRDGERERLRAGHWTGSTSRALAAQSALLAVRWMRRFGDVQMRRRDAVMLGTRTLSLSLTTAETLDRVQQQIAGEAAALDASASRFATRHVAIAARYGS